MSYEFVFMPAVFLPGLGFCMSSLPRHLSGTPWMVSQGSSPSPLLGWYTSPSGHSCRLARPAT